MISGASCRFGCGVPARSSIAVTPLDRDKLTIRRVPQILIAATGLHAAGDEIAETLIYRAQNAISIAGNNQCRWVALRHESNLIQRRFRLARHRHQRTRTLSRATTLDGRADWHRQKILEATSRNPDRICDAPAAPMFPASASRIRLRASLETPGVKW